MKSIKKWDDENDEHIINIESNLYKCHDFLSSCSMSYFGLKSIRSKSERNQIDKIYKR